MTTKEIRQQAKRRIEKLSADLVPIADNFLAYLEDRRGRAATDELLAIPRFLESFKKGRQEIATGKVISVEKLKRKR